MTIIHSRKYFRHPLTIVTMKGKCCYMSSFFKKTAAN